MRIQAFCLTIVSAAMMIGCGGGGKGLEVGSIQGPDSVNEGTSADYSVSASGDSGITYLWAVEPSSAGQIVNGTSATMTFNPAEVTSDTSARITVVVTSDNGGPEIRARDITVRNVSDPAPPELIVGEISGPSEISEYSAGSYSISATGDSGITFAWSCVPPDLGIFELPDKESTVFSTIGVDIDTQVEISVEVNSDHDGPEQRDLLVTVLNSYEPASYLAAGHPMTGINYRRNNRSTCTLTGSLTGEEIFEPPYEENETFYNLFVDDDERLYLSAYYYKHLPGTDWYGYDSFKDNFYLWSFYFGDDVGTKVEREGWDVIITDSGAIVSGRFRHNKTPYGHGDDSYYQLYVFRLTRFASWPGTEATASEGWGGVGIPFSSGEPGTRFNTFLPLPDNRVVTYYEPDRYGTHLFVQVLDEALELIQESELAGLATGISFDENTGSIYVNTTSGLYCYNWGLGEMWNTVSSVPAFADGPPVIGDDGAILGCCGGTLSRIEPDGTPGPQQPCGAFLNPVVLNDGTVAVIADSSILLFDPVLVQIGSIPLPSGADTGNLYTRPPLVDAVDNIALFLGPDLYVIERDGSVVAHRTFESDILELRLGPDHLFVVLDSGALLRIHN